MLPDPFGHLPDCILTFTALLPLALLSFALLALLACKVLVVAAAHRPIATTWMSERPLLSALILETVRPWASNAASNMVRYVVAIKRTTPNAQSASMLAPN